MRKIISLFLCAIMLIMPLGSVFAAGGKFDAALNQETIFMLESLGVLAYGDEFVQKETADVTKGEFARLLMCLLNMRNEAVKISGIESMYKDVTSKTLYSSEIIVATKLGFFGEIVPSYFYPAEKAETDWALKAVARLLGYSYKLRRNSLVVNTLGLSKKIPSGKYLTRDGALALLKNALDVPLLTAYGLSTDGIRMQAADGETVLGEYFDLVKYEGVVYADFYTSLQDERALLGSVRIGDETFKIENIDTKSLVGLNVIYYAKEIDEESVIVYMEKEDNVEIALSSSNIIYDYDKNCYIVQEEKGEKEYDISVQALVSYNGTPIYDRTKMQPLTGEVILVDNDTDGEYDVVKIREFKNLVVKAYDKNEKRVHDITSTERDLYLDNYEEVTVYAENGKIVDKNKITEGNVLTVYESADGECVEIYIQSIGTPMTIEQINFGDNEIVADGITYKMSADLMLDKSVLHIGQVYYFYINYWNEVVYVKTDWKYQTFWLLGTHKDERNFGNKVAIKGMETSGTITTYELADKVNWLHYDLAENKIVKERITKEDAYLRLNSNGGAVNRRMMKIGVDTVGAVTDFVEALSVPTRAQLLVMESDYPLIKMDYIINEWPAYATYNEAGIQSEWWGSFQYWLYFSSTAKEFLVETNASTEEVADEDMCVQSIRYKPDERRNVADLEIYMQSKDGIAAEYVVKDITVAANTSLDMEGYYMYPYVVTKVTECIDEQSGEQIAKIECVSRTGGATTFYTEDLDTVKRANLIENGTFPAENKQMLEPGDIITTEKNAKGVVSRIKLAYDYVNDYDSFPGSGIAGIAATIKGKVTRVHENLIEYEGAAEGIPAGSIMAINASNYLVEYDVQKQTAKRITADEVYADDTIVTFWRYSSLYMTVVYRNR